MKRTTSKPNLFLDRLDALHRRGKLVLQGDWRELDCAHGWQEFVDSLRAIDWVVFSRGVWDRRAEAGRLHTRKSWQPA